MLYILMSVFSNYYLISEMEISWKKKNLIILQNMLREIVSMGNLVMKTMLWKICSYLGSVTVLKNANFFLSDM